MKDLLDKHGADALVIVNFEDSGQPGTRHVSGFSGTTSIVVIGPKSQHILTDGRYVTQVGNESSDFELVSVDRAGYLGSLIELLSKLEATRLLIDPGMTHHDAILKIKDKADHIEFVTQHNLLHDLRAVKTEKEISKIQDCVDICAKAFNDLLPEIKAGVTERYLAAKLEFLMKINGADNPAFDTIVVSGARTALPHGRPTDKVIEEGDLVTIDFGARKDGFNCDITRTIAVGQPSEKLREIYTIVKQAQQLGCDELRAGKTGAQIDAICRDYIKEKGYGDYFMHGTGHGLGREVHEQPNISSANQKPLPVGAVVTIEPGIYIERVGGVRIEDDLVVRKNGADNLSKALTRDLLIL